MECLHTLLQEYVVQARTVDVSESTYIPLPFRTAYAMAIALFSVRNLLFQLCSGDSDFT